jgi:hypothetical protein
MSIKRIPAASNFEIEIIPFPAFGIINYPGFKGIVLNVIYDISEFFIISYNMVKTFLLPEVTG